MKHEIHVDSSTFHHGEPKRIDEWETAVESLLDQGSPFLAYEVGRSALNRFPEAVRLRQLLALALIRTGALEEARRVLDSIAPATPPTDLELRRLYRALRSVAPAPGTATPDEPSPEMKTALLHLVGLLAERYRPADHSGTEEETLGLLARIHKGIWTRTSEPAEALAARDAYLAAHQRSGGIWTGVNAASMSWLVGERGGARRLAREVLSTCDEIEPADGHDPFWVAVARGECLLLLERADDAAAAYREAAKLGVHQWGRIDSARRQLRLLAAGGLEIPASIVDSLRPPTVVAFTGHLLDRPDRPASRFPPELVPAVRDAIARELDRLEANIGFTSAAAGADLLFVDAMVDRGAEINLVLPFSEESFVDASVRYAGQTWVHRFERACKLARTVRLVTEEPHLGHRLLFDFAGRIFPGYGALRASALGTSAHLLAVVDPGSPLTEAGSRAVVARWRDADRLHLIDLRTLRAPRPAPPRTAPIDPTPAPPPGPSPASTGYRRVIRTLLFADVVGYSHLQEYHTPTYMTIFLERLASRLGPLTPARSLVNTWGDAVFVVMEDALPLARYALALRQVVCDTDWSDLGLPERMSVRIALHAGPVFESTDPLTARTNYYGSQVNRAARLEPVAAPGTVYASEQFVALLWAEHQSADGGAPPFDLEPVGSLPLAKGFGLETAYHLRPPALGPVSSLPDVGL